MTHRILKYHHLLCLVILLSSCATWSPQKSSHHRLSWLQRQRLLLSMPDWAFKGKIAIQSKEGTGSATMHWTQKGKHYQLSFNGPLGTSFLVLDGNPHGVTMIDHQGKPVHADNAETLLNRFWHQSISVKPLFYWIRGLPDPHLSSQITWNSDHLPATITQANTKIEYLSYHEVSGVMLPYKIKMTGVNVKMKMVIHQWDW